MKCSINNEIEKSKYSLIKSKAQDAYTVQLQGFLLHSKFDPLKEAEKFVKNKIKKNHLHVLFGVGLGYYAKYMIGLLKDNEMLIIIEPNENLLKEAIKLNLKDLDYKKVMIVKGDDISDFSRIIHPYVKQYLGKIEYIESPNYGKIYPEMSKDIIETIKNSTAIEILNINTTFYFAEQWQRNLLYNLFYNYNAVPLASLSNKLSCPVVIASGGPSLIKQLPLLKLIKNKAFIISAGSTINALLKNHIQPDAIVTIDGGEENYRNFRDIKIDHVPLFFHSITHKDIPLQHRGKKVIFEDQVSAVGLTEKVFQEPIGFVIGGPSVANICLDIARQITSGPICVIGQDLAYTNNLTHATGIINQQNADKYLQSRGRKLILQKGYYGEDVPTDYVFLSMKKAFENYISFINEQGDKHEFFNATEGGLQIEGMENIAFSSFVNEYCQKNYEEEISTMFYKNSEQADEWERVCEIYERERKNLGELINYCEKAVNILKAINKNDLQFNSVTLNKLAKLDKKITTSCENNIMSHILQPALFIVNNNYLEKENESFKEANERIYNKNLKLYSELKSKSEKMYSWLTEIIEQSKTNYKMG
ncbi:motility associated factor glycosyltransferase family protein [Heliorestis acidaminivorans]|uniref:Motility associated factor glycosyltransferase family protein n=1 Tax=Heliorestis acidaminivorans TaxID=553427 RepID=A0A6I0EVL8_9FIRM|nr:6-hydroxymethylpterin diphosphokinase MptE-like protein [Heliorestis acidaminivorans]KAB2953629.1 motility associated factor glycosyltransferase family protein [Heliorestis acidaminivorans]